LQPEQNRTNILEITALPVWMILVLLAVLSTEIKAAACNYVINHMVKVLTGSLDV